MYTDASTFGLGAVLMQCDETGKNHVIAYASRTLSSAEADNTPRSPSGGVGFKIFSRYQIGIRNYRAH